MGEKRGGGFKVLCVCWGWRNSNGAQPSAQPDGHMCKGRGGRQGVKKLCVCGHHCLARSHQHGQMGVCAWAGKRTQDVVYVLVHWALTQPSAHPGKYLWTRGGA